MTISIDFVFNLEGDMRLGAIRDHLPILDLHVQLHDFRDAQSRIREETNQSEPEKRRV